MAAQIRSKDAIPDQAYRKMVLTLMDKQAGREVATAEVFGQCVLYAPTVEDKIRITRFQHEELKHFQLIARLMAELGVDMDAYVRDRQKAGARFTGDEAGQQVRQRRRPEDMRQRRHRRRLSRQQPAGDGALRTEVPRPPRAAVGVAAAG